MSAPNNILTNVKIIKRHNAANVIIGILCILSIAIPVVLWILPWFQVYIGNVVNPSSEYPIATGIYTLELFHLGAGLFNKFSISYNAIVHNGWAIASIRENNMIYYLFRENLYAAAAWYILSALLAILLFFQGIALLFKGKVKHPFGIVTTAFFAMVANGMLLADSYRLGAYMKYSLVKALETNGGSLAEYKFIFWPSIIVAGAAGGIWLIMLISYLAGLRNKYYLEDIEFVETEKPQPFERNDGVSRNTLPQGITSVGGHAYARSSYLEIANIPEGISELGQGAFSNCLRLKIVSIPLSVKRIGPNCFFNTPRLKRINYAGSKEQWRHVSRGSNWLLKAGSTTVLCNDGAISVNPYH